jgi:hypothetical protein
MSSALRLHYSARERLRMSPFRGLPTSMGGCRPPEKLLRKRPRRSKIVNREGPRRSAARGRVRVWPCNSCNGARERARAAGHATHERHLVGSGLLEQTRARRVVAGQRRGLRDVGRAPSRRPLGPRAGASNGGQRRVELERRCSGSGRLDEQDAGDRGAGRVRARNLLAHRGCAGEVHAARAETSKRSQPPGASADGGNQASDEIAPPSEPGRVLRHVRLQTSPPDA